MAWGPAGRLAGGAGGDHPPTALCGLAPGARLRDPGATGSGGSSPGARPGAATITDRPGPPGRGPGRSSLRRARRLRADAQRPLRLWSRWRLAGGLWTSSSALCGLALGGGRGSESAWARARWWLVGWRTSPSESALFRVGLTPVALLRLRDRRRLRVAVGWRTSPSALCGLTPGRRLPSLSFEALRAVARRRVRLGPNLFDKSLICF